MPSNSIWPLIAVILLSLGLGFVNGFNDTANWRQRSESEPLQRFVSEPLRRLV